MRLAALTAAFTVVACGATTGAVGEPLVGPDALVIAAASDLRPAFEEVGPMFTAATGHEVVFDYGSSGQLAQRIIEGAPVDVFASADDTYVEMVLAQGRGDPDSLTTYAIGRIVIWSRSDMVEAAPTLGSLRDHPQWRVAIANPDHAPYGRAAREALEASGIWDEIADRLVLGENISHAHQLAASGNAETVITAQSLAIAAGESGEWSPIDESLHEPLHQTMVVVAPGPRQSGARAFAAFVTDPDALSVMNRYGFSLPGEEAH